MTADQPYRPSESGRTRELGLLVECWQFHDAWDKGTSHVLRVLADRLEGHPDSTLLGVVVTGEGVFQAFVDTERGPIPAPEKAEAPDA